MQWCDIRDRLDFSKEKMKKNNLFETSHLFCDLYCFEPGQSQKPHTHEGADKLYFVLEGKGRFRVGGEERDLQAHQIALAPDGVEHGVTNTGDQRLVVLVVMTPNLHASHH